MTTPVNSASATSAPAGAPLNAPATTPALHAQDSMEMREPANPPSTCFCTSICSTISSIWRYIKTKIHQLFSYFFPNPPAACPNPPVASLPEQPSPPLSFHTPLGLEDALNTMHDPHTTYREKLIRLMRFTHDCHFHFYSHPSRDSLYNEHVRNVFAALPSDLAQAIVLAETAFRRDANIPDNVDPDDRLELSISGQGNYTLSHSCFGEGIRHLLGHYPEEFWSTQHSYLSSNAFSVHDKIAILKSFINFDLNVRFESIDMRSTTTEEEWKAEIRRTVGALPEEVKQILFARMWNLVQPRDGRDAFLENPRSPEAKQAVEETLQAFPNNRRHS